MKKVVFKRVSAQNFLSFGKEEVYDFENGITAVFGVNRDKNGDGNGSGKSTLINVVYFALFGNTIKSLNKSEIVNRIAGKNCEVKLEFDVIDDSGVLKGYVIERGIDPSFCRLYENGAVITRSSIPETTKYIASLIGTNEVMFKNTIMMSLENTVPFMAQKAVEKKAFIESMFDLTFVKEMSKIVKADADRYASMKTSSETRIESIKNSLEKYKESEREYEENKKARIEELKKYVDDVKVKISDLIGTLKTYDQEVIDNFPEKLKSVEKDVSLLECDVNTARSENSILSGDVAASVTSIANDDSHINAVESVLHDLDVYVRDFIDKNGDRMYYIGGDSKFEDFDGEIYEMEARIEKANDGYHKLNSEICVVDKSIDEIKSFGDICPTCGRPYDSGDVETRDRKMAELKSRKEALTVLMAKVRDKRRALTDEINNIKSRKNTYMNGLKIVDRYRALKDMVLSEKDRALLNEKKESAEARILSNTSMISDKSAKIEVLESEISDMKAEYDKNVEAKNYNDGVEFQVKNLKENAKNEYARVKADLDKENVFTKYIRDAESEIEKENESLEKSSHMCDVYKVARAVLSDDGYPAFMVKQYINALNSSINKYLVQLDAPVQIKFDEYFEDVSTDILTGESCSYASLSSGEKKRADLACMFAFMDMRKSLGAVSFNMAFFDEVLDSALSVAACEKLMGILVDRCVNLGESAMVITHKTELKDDPSIDHSITVEKIGGVSRIVR